jgi:hypothetical protein
MLPIPPFELGDGETLIFGAGVAVGFGVGVELGLIVTLALRLLSQDRNAKLETTITAMIPRARMYLLFRPIFQLVGLVKLFVGSASMDPLKETLVNRIIELFLMVLVNFISSHQGFCCLRQVAIPFLSKPHWL